jgi:hypothetical protein
MSRSPRRVKRLASLIVILGLVGVVVVLAVIKKPWLTESQSPPPESPPRASQKQVASSSPTQDTPTVEVAKALMVTVELDFGPRVPTIAEALREIERRYDPEDGSGRTFAILDAYGEPTPDGKKLHISMHVSTEKPGTGSLVFRRTGEVLWNSQIVPATTPPASAFSGKNLTMMLADETGRPWMLDGSGGATSVLDAKVRDTGIKVREFWPDGAEREVTFVYSACGCPVKVMVRRRGERTARTKELPVIFPDDPPAVSTISQLMGW